MTTIETNPSEIFGFGTWELWGAGRVPVGVDTTQTEFNEVEKTDGEKTHTLTVAEMPTHDHLGKIYSKNYNDNKNLTNHRAYANNFATGSGTWNYTSSGEGSGQFVETTETATTGDSQAHNNLQPYITCYMFKRTA